MARFGLRMMPTFPSPSLKFRTAGLLQYGFKARVGDRLADLQRSREMKSIERPQRGREGIGRTAQNRRVQRDYVEAREHLQ